MNGMGFWLLIILLHIAAVNSGQNIKNSHPKALENNQAGKYRSGFCIERKGKIAMGKFPIITAFYWKAEPNLCQIGVTKTWIENL